MANIVNQYGQVKVGVRTQLTPPPSSLWTNVYSVYNADAVGSSSLKTSLFAAYNGESNANDSFGANNGTAVGGLTYTTGKIGNAFSFNGTNAAVELPANSMNLTGDFTISFWVYMRSRDTNVIMSNYGNDGINRGFYIDSDGSYALRFVGNYLAPYYSLIKTDNSALFDLNVWMHFTFISKNGVGQWYKNGVANGASGPVMTNGYITNNKPIIGGYRSGNTGTIGSNKNMALDAFNLWNKALTQSEITELYNSGNGAQYITDNFYKPTTNDALNTYNGTAQGGLTYGVGKVGTAFQFNGTNSYVSLPDNSLNPSGDFSISFWVKFNSVAATYINLIENYYAPSSNRYGYNIYLQLGKIRFATYDGTTTNMAQSTSSLSINQWYHITLSKKISNAPKLYINGVSDIFPQTLGNISNNIVYNSLCKSLLGVDFDYSVSYNSFLNGSLDAINIWNKELTQSEITELYNSGNGKQYPN